MINMRGYLGSTALSRAAIGGHLECVRALLDREDIDANIARMRRNNIPYI